MTSPRDIARVSSMEKWNELLATPPYWADLRRDDDDDFQYQPSSLEDLLLIASDMFSEDGSKNKKQAVQLEDTKEGVTIYTANDSSIEGTEYFGEIESRAIQMSNLDPATTKDELSYELAKIGGDFELLDMEGTKRGVAFVRFYDLRAARRVRAAHLIVHGKAVVMTYGAPKPVDNKRKPPNNGTLVLFHLKRGVSDEKILEVFGKYGEIRQIRGTPTKDTQKFVEFWDTRAAAKALKATNAKTVLGSKLAVEYSLPGGYRKNLEQFYETRLPTIERVQKAQ